VAGGGRGAGSEDVAVSSPARGNSTVVVANLDPKSRPTVLVDLSSPWPFHDGIFDLVVSTWVVEHLTDPWLFFREAHRVLRPGGVVLVAVPFIHRVHGSPSDYWRLTDAALVMLGHQAGFSSVRVETIGGGPFLAVVELLWPVIRIPVLGSLLALLGLVADVSAFALIRLTGKGIPLIGSYPLSYLLCARKKAA
jgi:SAM-dependent methyltransferase